MHRYYCTVPGVYIVVKMPDLTINISIVFARQP